MTYSLLHIEYMESARVRYLRKKNEQIRTERFLGRNCVNYINFEILPTFLF